MATYYFIIYTTSLMMATHYWIIYSTFHVLGGLLTVHVGLGALWAMCFLVITRHIFSDVWAVHFLIIFWYFFSYVIGDVLFGYTQRFTFTTFYVDGNDIIRHRMHLCSSPLPRLRLGGSQFDNHEPRILQQSNPLLNPDIYRHPFHGCRSWTSC